jgi:hypothetical protein
MRAVEVFTPTKIPTVTFVHEHLREREERLRDSLDQGGVLVSISGPSKSGKTAFVNTVLGPVNVVPVTGGGVKNIEDLWIQVFHQIGTPIEKIESATENSIRTTGASGSLEGNAFIAKGKVEGSLSAAKGVSTTTTTTSAINLYQLLVDELAGTGTAIFIDDFHYIDANLQAEVARQIKDAIAKDVRIICAAVPYRSENILRANQELQGRIVSIDFSYWTPEVLVKIADAGFNELNIDISDDLKRFFANESAGSPQLMQSLCLDACLISGIRERASERAAIKDSEEIRAAVCGRSAVSTDYSSTLEKLKVGPRVRGRDRKHYALKDGSIQDVYVILLKAMALAPPTLHFQYRTLIDRIGSICSGETPVGSSVTSACEQIALIANTGQQRDLIEWSSENDVLDIREPLLLFHLRWNG